MEKLLTGPETELLYNLRTEPKIIKARQLKVDSNGKPFTMEIKRLGNAVNFAICPEEFALASHIEAIREGKPLGPLSYVYWDLREPSDQAAALMGQVLARTILPPKSAYCTGIPQTGNIMAEKYALFSGVTYLDLFQKVNLPEGGTTIKPKEGAPKGRGRLLVIVDDVLSKGTNSVPALQAAEELDFIPLALLVLVDRQQGGVQKLNSLGYQVRVWQTAEEILSYYQNHSDPLLQITPEQYHLSLSSLY